MDTKIYNNLVNFNDIIFSNSDQKGGGSDDIIITFTYKKYLDDSGNTLDESHYNNIYIVFLENDRFIAYEMFQIVLSNTYSITLPRKPDTVHRFKFMRGDKLEFLDIDYFLSNLPGAIPVIKDDRDTQIDDPIDINEWNTAWRWIYPSKNDQGQTYYFTYYLPTIVTLRSGNEIQVTINRTFDSLYENFNIQTATEIFIRKLDGSSENITLSDIDIGTNIDFLDTKYFKYKILCHNLGCTESNIIKYIDANLYNKYTQTSVRNENMLQYFEENIEANIRIVKPQLNLLQSKIEQLLNQDFEDKYVGNFNSASPPNKVKIIDAILYPTDQEKARYYFYDQMIYTAEKPSSNNTFTTFIDGMKVEYVTNLEIKQNDVYKSMDDIFGIFEKLSSVSVNLFSSFPMSLLEYIEAKNNMKKDCYKYFVRCLLFRLLLDTNVKPISVPSDFIKIDNEYLNMIKFNEGYNKIVVNPISANYKLGKLTTDFSNTITINNVGPLSVDYYDIKSDCLINKETNMYFYDINQKFLFNLNWIAKYLGNLIYQLNEQSLALPQRYPTKYYDYSTLPGGPLKKLIDIINKNTDDKSGNTFYKYLKAVYNLSENIKVSNAYKPKPNNKKIDNTGKFDTSKSSIPTKILTNAFTNVLIAETDTISVKISKSFGKKYTNEIELDSLNTINDALIILEKPIRLFARSFWINMNEITITNFINDLTVLNKIKLYYKILYIGTLLKSNLIDSKIELSYKASEFKITADSKSVNKLVNDKSSLEFFELINNNDTINKLFKLARHHLVRGNLILDTPPFLLEHSDMILSQPYIQNIRGIETIDDTFTNSRKYLILELFKIESNKIDMLNFSGVLLNLIDETNTDPIKGAVTAFKNIVDQMVTKEKHVNDALNLIPNVILTY
jgi:hypothetical protein